MSTKTFSVSASVPGTYKLAVRGTRIFRSAFFAMRPLERDFKHSLNLACAVRRDWNEAVRCDISSSNCFLSCDSCCIGRSVSLTEVLSVYPVERWVATTVPDWPDNADEDEAIFGGWRCTALRKFASR
jgi:hypothetical protein